jgi:FlaA1/EpsC-like NDP-sugar epimerase
LYLQSLSLILKTIKNAEDVIISQQIIIRSIGNAIKSFSGIINKLTPNQVIFVSDALVSLLCLYVTLRIILGHDFQTLQMSFILKHCLVFALVSFSLFSWIRGYKGASQYIALDKIPSILGCGLLANLLYHPLMLLMGELPPLALIFNTMFFTIGLLLPRLIVPYWRHETAKTGLSEASFKIPIIVVGYNEHIGTYLRTKGTEAAFPYHLMGILLNAPLNEYDISPPFPVLGMVNDFVAIVQKLSSEGCEPRRFLIAQESLGSLFLRQVLLKFQGKGILSLAFDMSPPSHEVTLRPLHLEDLLSKINAYPEWQDVRSLIDSSCILITGASDGMIHQLALHTAGFYPKRLVLVDPSEYALANLKIKLDQLYPDVRCDYVIAAITDHPVMDHLVKIHQPKIIIHGDRVAHPDLIAQNLLAAIQKNVFSTLHLAEVAQKEGVQVFVHLNAQSTTPLAEGICGIISYYLQTLDKPVIKKYPTRFLVIKGGDVWNNLDSPTAFWPEHLSHGLSITAPTSDAYSCLLSAKEAARTILQAIAKALEQPLGEEKTRGKALHLRGSDPSRYLDMIRSLILLEGLIPETDCKVNFVTPKGFQASAEETETLQPLTPGILISDPKFPHNVTVIVKLATLLKEKKTSQIIELLEKGRTDHQGDKTSSKYPSLALTG